MEDGKQSFGGFGFEVKKLKLYDSPADFEAGEDYRKDYSDPDIKLEDESMIVYAEIEVTNESDSKQAYYPNELIAAPGTKEKVKKLIGSFKKKEINVFQGDYTGVYPDDPGDVISLKKAYQENGKSSAPTFHYVLKDVIHVE